jgi:hypothetical protein
MSGKAANPVLEAHQITVCGPVNHAVIVYLDEVWFHV